MALYKGIVQKGEMRGSSLGFPTANIFLEDANVSGIYAAKVFVGDKEYKAAVYADTKRNLLEANLLDFSGDLYGKEIRIELLKKIREDKQFENESELRAAIADDIEKIRDYLKTP